MKAKQIMTKEKQTLNGSATPKHNMATTGR
jgi:hypothetical protein